MKFIRSKKWILTSATCALALLLLLGPVGVVGDESVGEIVGPAQAFGDVYTKEIVEPIPVLLIDGNPVYFVGDTNKEIQLSGVGTHYISQIEQNSDYSLMFTGSGTWLIQSPLTTTGSITILSGMLDTSWNDITASAIFIGSYDSASSVTVKLGTSRIDTQCFAIRGSRSDFDAGTSTISTTLLFDDTLKTGHQYNNVEIKSDSKVYGFIEGRSSFHTLTLDNEKACYLNNDVSTGTVGVISGDILENKVGTKPTISAEGVTITSTPIAVAMEK